VLPFFRRARVRGLSVRYVFDVLELLEEADKEEGGLVVCELV
jgi:hypothetical protein